MSANPNDLNNQIVFEDQGQEHQAIINKEIDINR